MSKINILTQQIYNRIAAGEVVDRPYSVVKELVENALDAGATEIAVYAELGGKQLIRVTDNGSGIGRDDLHAAYLPHATSKISCVQDLDDIHTLGFRGEAVASIASVSQMSITSKVKDCPCYTLNCNGGEIGEITETAGEDGTDIFVRNLFYNTPVRRKFLKSDRAEEADITNFVSRFILSRPDVAFQYYLNDKLTLQSYGTTEEEALVCVYGASIIGNCFHIDAEKHGIRIRGYIGNQNFYKNNKSYQSIFLNGRYIVNATLSAAIGNAYASYLMKRQYPFYVLYLDVPTEIVDVNVHPNKADVRFADNQIIYGCVYSVISAVLDGNSKALAYVVPGGQKEPIPAGEQLTYAPEPQTSLFQNEVKSETISCSNYSYEDAKRDIEAAKPQKSVPIALPFEETEGENQGEKPTDPLAFGVNQFSLNSPLRQQNRATAEEKAEDDAGDAFEENKRYLEEMEKKNAKQEKIDTSCFLFKGTLFNTYLLYEYGDSVYLIDQHAAHERLIFDRLKEQIQNRCVAQQPMLLPYILDVNAYENAFLSEQLQTIRDIGFEIDPFGTNSYKISAVPVDLQDIDLTEFFGDILSDISGLKAIKLDDLLKDKLAMAACKAAIKGGMALTEAETDKLLSMIDGNLGLKCPHGRPVVVKLTKYEIEKMFKRIV